MPVAECLERISHREYKLWLQLFEAEWNEPNRSDHYLMQIAQEVRRGNFKKASAKLSSYKIPFTKPTATHQSEREAYAKRAKALWMSRANG